MRYTLEDMALEQSRQMGRLCDLADPNVKIIYISPVPVSEEFQQYFSKLLGLKPAVLSGDVEHQTQMDERFTIIVPDALESFPVRGLLNTFWLFLLIPPKQQTLKPEMTKLKSDWLNPL